MPFTAIAKLTPQIVWQHFATLCAIPRPSKHEAAVREHLLDWATARGLAAATDDAGNLLLRKAATAGCEKAPTLALQGHLDMVCQAESGVAFDFLRSPIAPQIDGDWLRAEATTLGADNGIGVALALAALEDPTLRHGPLEVLLTVDEEAGMGGAHGLAPGWLQASVMLNLDTEEWGAFYLGCAGGCDINVSADFATELATTSPPAGFRTWTLSVGGLRGGHSGCDIHLRRGNANRLLAEALLALDQALAGATGLVTLDGGNARNALPREASATLCFAASDEAPARRCLETLLGQWRATLGGADGDAGVTLQLEPGPAAAPPVLAKAARQALLNALTTCPYGVAAMSADFPGVVESSNNLGIVELAGGRFAANLMVRSLRDAETRVLAEKIAGVFTAAGCRVAIDGHYPGWTPNPASPLLALCRDVYRRTFGADSVVQVIHAGLECGIIGAKYPGLDAISFGPTIRGAHAPGESVDIASVERCWTLLRALIAEIAQTRAQTRAQTDAQTA